MRRGFSVPELAIALTLMGLVTLFGLPRVRGLLDRIAVEQAAGEVTMTISLARHLAIAWSTRARLTIGEDSLMVDTLGAEGWARWRSLPGPAAQGVRLTVSNPVVVFSSNGLAWGLSNTRVILRRGSHTETITMSRVGRVKRW
ncbi:MAG TPA: prepilin-type N-terminal cleavage/methylation domain-containing protein [Gemmatimonadales bacterium]|nr:prepilin-type N-terminal cleavage/methylation domain-containing protein [Gemmatimonadales bacterium]